jgi:hypothetical protein
MPLARRLILPVFYAGCSFNFLSAAPESADNPTQILVEWKVAHFSPGELRDGASDDSTVLGYDANPNLLRYALGLGPQQPMRTLIAIRPEGEHFEMITPLAIERPDVICQLEDSTDLDTWNIAVLIYCARAGRRSRRRRNRFGGLINGGVGSKNHLGNPLRTMPDVYDAGFKTFKFIYSMMEVRYQRSKLPLEENLELVAP